MRWFMALWFLMLPWVSQAAVRVELVDGRPVVKISAAEVVAWPLGAGQLAILAMGPGDAQLDGSVKGVVADVKGMHGIVLQGVDERAEWNIVRGEGEWLLRRGKANGKPLSAVLLKDGWWFEGEKVGVRKVRILGEEWQVGAVGQNVRLGGAVLGAVRKVGEEPRVVEKEESLEKKEIVGVGEALAKLGGGKVRGRQVPVYPAEAIEPMAGPMVESENLDFDEFGVYVPGTVVSLTLPEEHLKLWEKGEVGRPVVEEDVVLMGQALLPAAEGVYFDELAQVQRGVAEAALGGVDEREMRLKLVAFYLAWQRPEEARGVLSLLPRRADGALSEPLARLYDGIAALAADERPKLENFDQRGELGAHAKLWRAVALGGREDYTALLKEWPNKTEVLAQYPPYLLRLAQIGYARAQVMVGNKNEAKQVVDGLASKFAEDGGVVPTEVLKLQGVVRLATEDESEGLEYLAKAAESTENLSQAARAKYEFVMALHQRKDLADVQLRNYLEELSLDWRGDVLEKNVLSALADLYDRAGEPREALERWRLMVRLFGDGRRLKGQSIDMNGVTERMADALLNVFDPENPRTYDPLTMLGLYYDFRELVPNDPRGDRVNEQVSKLLTDKTLWARALPLLEQQLEYRPLEEDARGRQVLLLAEVLRRQGRAAESLKLLDKWKPVANTQVTSRNWSVAEARTLMDLKRYESVRRTLADLVGNDLEAAEMSLTAAWELGAWDEVILGLQRELDGVAVAQVEADKGLQLKVLRLAYALGQNGNGKELSELRQRFSGVMERVPELADGLNVIAVASGVPAVQGSGNLASLSKTMAELSALRVRVHDTREQMARAAAAQAEYDAKMRYMELLPPPSL